MALVEQGQISSGQMNVLMFPAILATAVLTVPSVTMQRGGHDMWMSPLWASVAGLLAIFIAYRLNVLFPAESMVESSVAILGKAAGKLFGLYYLLYLPQLNGVVLREYGEFILSAVLPRTPLVVVMGSLIVVCAINVASGIEVIGRSSVILVSLMIAFLTLIVLLLIPEFDFGEWLPVAEHGLGPSLLGAVAPASWLSEYVLLSFLYPFVSNRNRILRGSLVSLSITVFTMLAVNISCLLLLGEMTDSFVYPFMIATRYVSYADFLQHIEALIIAIWIAGMFVKISLFLYMNAIAAAQWLGLREYRPLVLPLALLTLVFAFWSVSNQMEFASLLASGGNIYTLFSLIILPGLLLLVAAIRGSRSAASTG